MKKLIITCLLLSSASVVSFAQANAPAAPPQGAANAQHNGQNKPAMNAEQMAQRRTKMETQQFGLSADQSTKVQAVETEFFTAMEKYRASGAQPNVGQMGNLTSRRDAKLKEIFTPEQYAKYEAGKSKGQNAPMAPAHAAPAAPANH